MRGWAYADGKLIYNLLDDHTVAVDAQTGKEVWRMKLDDVDKGVTMTQAAFTADDKVFVGIPAARWAPMAGSQALDVKDGQGMWSAYTNGPDKDVLIGADFKPFYPWMKGKDLGVTTWPAEMWHTGARRLLGLGVLRSRPEACLLRHVQSGTAHAVAAARPQSVEQRRCSRAIPATGAGQMGLSVHAA